MDELHREREREREREKEREEERWRQASDTISSIYLEYEQKLAVDGWKHFLLDAAQKIWLCMDVYR